MDDAKNFVLGIFQTVKERFGNPLISAFVIAWVVWNFRLLLVLIGSGDGGWQAKITYIDTKLMVHWWHWVVHGTLVPLVAALLWIYVLPPLLRRVAAHHEKHTNLTREALFQISGTRTLSEEEASEMRSVMLRQRAEWRRDKLETKQSLEDYERTISEKLAQVETLENEIQAQREELEHLKAPPPRQKASFFDKEPAEVAQILGIHFLAQPGGEPPLILFYEKSIQWPWNPSPEQAFDLPEAATMRGQLSEESMLAMFVLSANVKPGTQMSRANWTASLTGQGIARTGEQIQTLYQHGFLSGASAEPRLTSEGIRFAKWLGDIGFHHAAAPNPARVKLIFTDRN